VPKEQKPAAELSRIANQTLDQTRGAVDHPNTRRFPPPWSVEELDAALPTFRPRGSLLSRKALTVSAHTPRVSRTA
jgi:hypothetical protein